MAPVPVLLMVRELGIGGCERDLAKLALRLDRSRFTPYVGCFLKEGIRADELKAAATPIIEFPVRSFGSASALAGAKMLWNFLRRESVGVVHCFDTPTDIFAVPLARMAGVPAVIASRLWSMETIPFHERILARWAEKCAHRIVVNARATGIEVENEGVLRERIYLSYNGVETHIFHPHPRARVAPLQQAELVVGTVCALRPEKRLDLLIDAFAAVRNILPGLRLLIVGSGSMEESWKERVRGHQLEEQCHFEPTRPDVADWMRSIDVFVTPSDTESFPNALLEAMACGCAVIGSNVGGIPEMIDPERAGQVFESGNLADLIERLKRVLSNADERAVWGVEAARRACLEFSMEHSIRRMEGLYTSLLNPSKVGGPSGNDDRRDLQHEKLDTQEQSRLENR